MPVGRQVYVDLLEKRNESCSHVCFIFSWRFLARLCGMWAANVSRQGEPGRARGLSNPPLSAQRRWGSGSKDQGFLRNTNARSPPPGLLAYLVWGEICNSHVIEILSSLFWSVARVTTTDLTFGEATKEVIIRERERAGASEEDQRTRLSHTRALALASIQGLVFILPFLPINLLNFASLNVLKYLFSFWGLRFELHQNHQANLLTQIAGPTPNGEWGRGRIICLSAQSPGYTGAASKNHTLATSSLTLSFHPFSILVLWIYCSS